MKKIIKIVSLVLVFAVITAVLAEFNFSDPPGTSKDADGDLSDGNIVKTDYSTFAVNSALIGTGSVSVSARSCILCTSDGMVIYEKQADVPLPMASITKVMSVIVALEKIEDSEIPCCSFQAHPLFCSFPRQRPPRFSKQL